MMLCTVHAQSHNGSRGKQVRGSDGKIIGYRKETTLPSGTKATVTNFTKAAQKRANSVTGNKVTRSNPVS